MNRPIAYVPVIDSRKELKQQLKEIKQQKERDRLQRWHNLYMEFSKQNPDLPDIDYERLAKTYFNGRNKQIDMGYLGFDSDVFPDGHPYKKYMIAEDKFVKFVDEKEKEKYNSMDVYDRENYLKDNPLYKKSLIESDTFSSSFARGLSFNFINEGNVYGDNTRYVYSSSSHLGETIGGLASFIMLSEVAGALGIGKLANLGIKGLSKIPKVGNIIVKAFGAPRYLVSKIKPLKFFLDTSIGTISKEETIAALKKQGAIKVAAYLSTKDAAVASLHSATMGAINNGLRTVGVKLTEETKMTPKQFKASIPKSMLIGFWNMYYLGILNEPKGLGGWGLRVLGDGIYTMTDQLYRVATGQQSHINGVDASISFIEGHLMGEISGALHAKPTKEMLMKAHANERINYYARELTGGNEGYKAYDRNPTKYLKKYFAPSNSLFINELKYRLEMKKTMPESMKRELVDEVINTYVDKGFYKVLNKAEFNTEYRKVDVEVDNKNKYYRNIKKYLKNLTPDDIKFLKDRNTLDKDEKGILEDFSKLKKAISKRPRPKKTDINNLETMIYDEFITKLNEKAGFDVADKFFKQIADIKEKQILEKQKTKQPKSTKQTIVDKNKRTTNLSPEEASSKNKKFILDYLAKNQTTLLKKLKGIFASSPVEDVEDALSDFYIYVSERDNFSSHRDLATEQLKADKGKVKKNIAEGLIITSIRNRMISDIKKQHTAEKKLTGTEGTKIQSFDEFEYEKAKALIHTAKIDLENPVYAILNNYIEKATTKGMIKNRVNRVIAFILKNGYNYSYAQIREVFKINGIDITENNLMQYIESIKKSLRKPPDEVVTKAGVEDKYTKKEILKAINEVNKDKLVRNEVSRAFKNIDKYYKGLYGIISLKNITDDIGNEYGIKTKNSFIRNLYKVIRAEITKQTLSFKDGEYIYIRHPKTDGDFIIYQKNVDTETFKNILNKVKLALKGFSNSKFGIEVNNIKGDTKYISSIDDIVVGFSKGLKYEDSIDNIHKISILKQIAKTDPIIKVILENSNYDINKMIGKFEKIDKAIGLKSRTPDEWESIIKENGQVKTLLTDLIKDAELEPSMPDSNVEDFISPVERGIVSDNERKQLIDSIKNDHRAVTDKDFLEDSFTKEVIKQTKFDLIPDEDMNSFLNATPKVKKYKNKLLKIWHEWSWKYINNLAAFEKSGEAGNAAVQLFYKLSSVEHKSSITASDIYTKTLTPLQAYDYNTKKIALRMLSFIDEVEMNKLIDSKTGRRTKNALKLLKTEIKKISIESISDSSNDYDPYGKYIVDNILSRTSDGIVLSKLLVQKFGIDPEDFLSLLELRKKMLYDAPERWMRTHGLITKDFLTSMKETISEGIIESAKKVGIDLSDIDFPGMSKKEIDVFTKQISARLSDIPTTANSEQAYFKKRLMNLISNFVDIPESLRWIHHTILRTPTMENDIKNEITNYLRGGITKGSVNMNPKLKLFFGRQFPTLKNLIEAGYKVVTDSLYNDMGTLKYFNKKLYDYYVADQFKNTFLSNFKNTIEASIDQLKRPDANQENAIKILTQFFKDNNTMIYNFGEDKPFIKKQMSDIQERIKIAPAEDVPELTERYKMLGDRMFIGEILENVLLGKKFRYNYKGNVEEFKFITEEQGQEFQRIWKGDFEFISMHRQSAGRNNKLNIELSKFLDNRKSPTLENYQGIYFNENAYRVLQDFVFRDTSARKSTTTLEKIGKNLFNSINIPLKLIRFYNPVIIGMYDLVQAGVMNPAFVKELPRAFDIYFKRMKNNNDGTPSEQKYIYEKFYENNLFNHTTGMPNFVSDIARVSYEILGKDPFFSEVVNRLNNQSNVFKKASEILKAGYGSLQSVTWGLDEIVRISAGLTMYKKFKTMYNSDKAFYYASQWTNLFLVQYSRLPTMTRKALNTLFLVPTYRLQTFRLYKEIIKNSLTGIKTMTTGEVDDNISFKVSNNPMKQGMFMVAPLIRSVLYKLIIKGLLTYFTAYQFDNIFDALSNYRLNQTTGDGDLDNSIKFLSLGTPLFDLERHFTRLKNNPKLWLQYNSSAFIGLGWMLFTNRNALTREPLTTVDIGKRPDIWAAQLGLSLLKSYMPMGTQATMYKDPNLNLGEKILNTFGISYIYSYKTPKQLTNQFRKAFLEAGTINERMKARREFMNSLNRLNEILFDKKYPLLVDEIEKRKSLIKDQQIN